MLDPNHITVFINAILGFLERNKFCKYYIEMQFYSKKLARV